MSGSSTVVCVASGPSFTLDQAELILAARRSGRCRVIVVNDNWRRIPTADVLYAADFKWWTHHLNAIRRSGFAGELWTQDARAASVYELQHVVSVAGNHLLPREDLRITQGGNGGFQAVMLARLLYDADLIPLVGYDMQRTGGKAHWFGLHPALLSNGDPRAFIKHFDAVAPALRAEGRKVKNCSIATALTCFERADLATTLWEEETCNQ